MTGVELQRQEGGQAGIGRGGGDLLFRGSGLLLGLAACRLLPRLIILLGVDARTQYHALDLARGPDVPTASGSGAGQHGGGVDQRGVDEGQQAQVAPVEGVRGHCPPWGAAAGTTSQRPGGPPTADGRPRSGPGRCRQRTQSARAGPPQPVVEERPGLHPWRAGRERVPQQGQPCATVAAPRRGDALPGEPAGRGKARVVMQVGAISLPDHDWKGDGASRCGRRPRGSAGRGGGGSSDGGAFRGGVHSGNGVMWQQRAKGF